jgi:hypothetical protein
MPIEELFICSSCKSKTIRKCICCECDIFSSCGCLVSKRAKQLELETDVNLPNVILFLCEECENKVLKNCNLKK